MPSDSQSARRVVYDEADTIIHHLPEGKFLGRPDDYLGRASTNAAVIGKIPSVEAVPSLSVTADVAPQTNPQPRTTTLRPTHGRPLRRRTTTVSVPLRKTPSSSGDQSPICVPSAAEL